MPGPAKQFEPEAALQAAMCVFWARGYEAASMSELMTAMGISKKSLYDTFGNKRSLFLQALQHYSRMMQRDALSTLRSQGSALQNLRKLLRKWELQASEPGSVGCMLGTNIADFSTNDEEVAEILRGLLSQIEEAFYQNLTAAKAAGEITQTVKPRDLARLLVAATQGTALIGRVLSSPTIPNSVGKSLLSLISTN